MASSSTQTFIKQLFVKNSDVGKIGDNPINPYEMCKSVIRVTSDSKLEGVQKVNNLWRIYLKDATSRLELLVDVKQIWINGIYRCHYTIKTTISLVKRCKMVPVMSLKVMIGLL